jgi:hypothetical protein
VSLDLSRRVVRAFLAPVELAWLDHGEPLAIALAELAEEREEWARRDALLAELIDMRHAIEAAVVKRMGGE